jgi:dipeptidyl aminopeptidase/acylaminoacyl peptidase
VTVPEDLASLVEVSSLALSPDGARLAVATRRADLATDADERRVVLFEHAAGSWARSAVPVLTGSLPAWSPAGDLLALVEHGASGGGRLVVHDLVLRQRHELLDWPDEVERLAFSPSGRLLGFVGRRPVPPPGVVLAGRPAPPRVLRRLQYRMDSTGWTADRPRHCYALELGAALTGAAPGEAVLRNLSGTAFDDADLVWLGGDESWAFVSRRHAGREWDLVSDIFVGEAGDGRRAAAEPGADRRGDDAADAADAARWHTESAHIRRLTAGDRLWGPLAYDATSQRIVARYQLVAEFPCDEKLAVIDPVSGALDELPIGVERSLTGPLVVSLPTLAPGRPSEARPASAAARPGPDAGQAFSLLADAGSVQLVQRSADPAVDRDAAAGQSPSPLSRLSGPGVVTAFDVAGGTVALGGRFAGQPAVVQVMRPARAGTGGTGADGRREPVTLYEPNAGYAEATGLLEPTYVGAKAGDGTDLDCWVLLPGPGTEIAGAALYVPGGGGQWGGADYVHDFQVFASAGIAVIFGNARGSGGYGEGWMRTVCGPHNPRFPGTGWGGVDRSDMLTITSAVLERYPQLPRDKVAVLGGSYGGLMAALLGFTSEQFCAVIAERGPFDLQQMAATSDEGAWFFDAYIGASAEEDPAQYAFSSVMSYVDGVKQPVLILHSEEDLRCPVQQAEELFTALRRRDADVTFVRFPGESHELSRSGGPVHRVQRIQIIRDWLVARLSGTTAAFEQQA